MMVGLRLVSFLFYHCTHPLYYVALVFQSVSQSGRHSVSQPVKDKVDILENKNQQVSKLSMNTDVSGVLPFFSVKNNR